MAHIRDLPSLRESVVITTPSGKRFRWADDEFRPVDVPSGERWSDTMPGGFETHDATLPRKPAVDYSDLDRLSTLTRYDASGGIIWQGRLERAPRVSGDQVAISPSAVGWQAHLEDDKSVQMVYRDIDLTRWSAMSSERRLQQITSGFGPNDPSTQSDITSGAPVVLCEVSDPWAVGSQADCEAWYDAGAVSLGSLYYAWKKSSNINPASNWIWSANLSSDDLGTATDLSGNLKAAGPGTGAVTATGTRRFAQVALSFTGAAAGVGNQYGIYWTTLAVYGDHGLTLRDSEPNGGFYDADIIGHALGQWCPLISTTSESLTASSFVIQHMSFIDPTTVGEIIRQTTRFGLRDWAVWDGPTFWLHDRGARGRSWRARVGPAKLEEAGPQVDRLWNSIIVAYQDVGGSTRTVGPTGSGADVEDDSLVDTDPENPANKLGITRRDLLTMGTSTAAGATEIGRQFLEQSKLLDSSGRATFVGYVEDDRGIIHPYSHVHSGDTVVFLDAGDTSARRIVRTDKDRASRSCSVDLDSPSEGLTALLERLQVSLVPLGLS